MAIADLLLGIGIGFFLGIGGAIFYLRWRMQKQLGSLENQMQDLMDMEHEMEEALNEDLESAEEEE